MRIDEYITSLRKKYNIVVTIDHDEIKITGLKENLQEEIIAELKRRKDEILKFFRSVRKKQIFDIIKAESKECYRLSSAQKRLYFLYACDKMSTSYNEFQVLRIGGPLDKERVHLAFNKIIQRQEILRTSFSISNEEPVQRVHQNFVFEMDWFQLSEDNVGGFVKEYSKPFDLETPPIRAAMVQIAPNDHVLVWEMHHIISDGASQGILMNEFIAAYSDTKIPELSLQYKDFAEWQHSEQQQQEIVKQKEFWLKEFVELPEVLVLPTDFPRPLHKTTEGNELRFNIGRVKTAVLKELAEKEGCTMFMVVLSLFNILLSKITNREDITIGTPISGRQHADLRHVIGMFVNTLPLLNYPKGESTFREFLRSVKSRTLACFDNQNYPYEQLIDSLKIERDLSRNPLFDITFVFENLERTTMEIRGLTFKTYEHQRVLSKFDITLFASEKDGEIYLRFEYCNKLFSPQTIEKFISYFKAIVSAVVVSADIRILDIDVISQAERHQLTQRFNDTATEHLRDQTVLSLFEEQVRKTPDNIALICGQERCTYAELDDKANSIAASIRSRSNTDCINNVALLFTPRIEMIAAIFGVLKAGCVYVPLSPDSPLERNRYIVADCRASLLLVQENLRYEDLIDQERVIVIDRNQVNQTLLQRPRPSVSPNDRINIIYTSGSTGKPKGVEVNHCGIANYTLWRISEYGYSEADVTLQLSPYNFDTYASNLYSALLSGGALLLIPEEDKLNAKLIANLIRKERVTNSCMTPGFYDLIVDEFQHDNVPSSLRFMVLAGEKASRTLIKKSESKLPLLVIYNEYGPTESSVAATFFKGLDTSTTSIIGRPIANTKIFILDKYNELLPTGVPGELCIGGTGVAHGYLNNKELTDKKFFKCSRLNGERIYKTGDLAKWRSDGILEFLGRMDTQVKIRGFRIELSEIENQLISCGNVQESLVILKETGDDKFLVAYCISEATLDGDVLRQRLAEVLPAYMVPSYYVQLDSFPLLGNGKIDRKALPAPNFKIGRDYLPPSNKVEEKLVSIWSDVLRINSEAISVNRSFFELGGHSLKATVMVNKIFKEFNVEFPLQKIFAINSIEKISEYIENEAWLRSNSGSNVLNAEEIILD